MAITSLSSAQSFSSIAWQQAQRNADQAEQAARSLQSKAQAAQAQANRAQENARATRVDADQANSRAGQARQGLAAMKSMAQVQSGFSSLRQQISSVLGTDAAASTAVQPTPVLNSSGQQTGALISVTA